MISNRAYYRRNFDTACIVYRYTIYHMFCLKWISHRILPLRLCDIAVHLRECARMCVCDTTIIQLINGFIVQ